MKFAVYKTSTSALVSTGDCLTLDTVAVGVDEKVITVPDDFSYRTHRIVNDVPTPYTNEQTAAFAEFRPGLSWNSSNCSWVDTRNLNEQKVDAWLRIKSARKAKIASNLATPYGVFDADTEARSNITDSIMLLQTLAGLGSPQTIDFTLADNTTVTLTTAEMVTVGLMLGQKVQLAHGQARLLRSQIDAAISAAELEAIVWTS